jgi:hypothetical protein
MKNRRTHTREVISFVEITFYRSDGFPIAPRLHSNRLVVGEWACALERAVIAAMMYGESTTVRTGGKRIDLTAIIKRRALK